MSNIKKTRLESLAGCGTNPTGRWFQDVIQQAIRNVKSVAVFIGPTGLGRWQVVELRAFISQCVEREIPVIPVLLPGATEIPKELVFLNDFSWVNLSKDINDTEALDNLEWGITGEQPRSRKFINPIVDGYNGD